MAHATGDLISPLDAEDTVAADGMIAACELLSSNPTVGWVTGDALTQDGERLWFPLVQEKIFPIGATSAFADKWVAPFHPNRIVARRQLVLRVGGWQAVMVGEDLTLVIALGKISVGKFIAQSIGMCRVWPKQVTKEASFKHEKCMVRKILRAMGSA